MSNLICFDNTIFILIVIVVAVAVIYIFFYYQKDIDNLKTQLNTCLGTHSRASSSATMNTINKSVQNSASDSMDNLMALPPLVPEPEPIFLPAPRDPVKIYDVNNLKNPLVYPTARSSSYIFRPMMDNPLWYTPTRGFPDKPSYIANLVETYLEDDKNKRFDKTFNRSEDSLSVNESNNNGKHYNPQLPSVLQLMGYQKYPSSSKYNYYVLLPSTGNSSPIKYVIETHRNEELYDGDIVKVLGKTYMVKKNKAPFEYFNAT